MMRGKLLKRSNYLKKWKTRTFELDTGLLVRTLKYYDSHGKLKGQMVLNGKHCVIQLLDENTSGKPHCFALSVEGGRTLVMSAGTDSSMRKWIDFLSKNGATLLGAEEVEQQELWRSVMEAEEKMKHDDSNEFDVANSVSISQAFVASQFNNAKRSSELSEQSSQSVSGSETEHNQCLEDPVTADARTRSSTSLSSNLLENSPIDAIAAEVQERMIQMGLYPEAIPSSSAAAKNHIFLSEDWQTCDKLIIFVGNSQGGGRGVPPGIWSRSGCSTLGIEEGSMISYLERSQAGGYGSVVLDTATHTCWVQEEDGTSKKVQIQGSETAERHISTVWERFILHAQAESVFVIAYGLGNNAFKEFLESNTHLLFSSKAPVLKSIALLESSHRNVDITQESVRRFLRQRAINWQQSDSVEQNLLIGDNEKAVGCLCMSAGSHSAETGGTNQAWIVPKVKDSVFRFFDFCVDVDAGVGDAGTFYTDRWVSMELLQNSSR